MSRTLADILKPRQVRGMFYRCRDIGYGVEEGTILGWWDGTIDTWGKYTIHDAEGGPTLYLFADEIRVLEFDDLTEQETTR